MKTYKPAQIQRISEKQKDGQSFCLFVCFFKAVEKFCRETKKIKGEQTIKRSQVLGIFSKLL